MTLLEQVGFLWSVNLSHINVQFVTHVYLRALDTAHMVVLTQTIYHYAVKSFGKLEALKMYTPCVTTYKLATVSSVLIA